MTKTESIGFHCHCHWLMFVYCAAKFIGKNKEHIFNIFPPRTTKINANANQLQRKRKDSMNEEKAIRYPHTHLQCVAMIVAIAIAIATKVRYSVICALHISHFPHYFCVLVFFLRETQSFHISHTNAVRPFHFVFIFHSFVCSVVRNGLERELWTNKISNNNHCN